MYLNGNDILPFLGNGADVETRRSLCIFTHAYKLAVEVVEGCPAYAVGTQENFLIVPVSRKSELAAVGAGGIPFLGNVWRIGLVPIRRIARRTELIGMVHVDGRAESLQLPVSGYIDVRPAAGVHTVHHEVRGAVGEGFHIMEFPFPVKGQAECSVLAVIDDGISLRDVGGERAAGRLPVDACQLGVGNLFVAIVLLSSQGKGKRCEASE